MKRLAFQPTLPFFPPARASFCPRPSPPVCHGRPPGMRRAQERGPGNGPGSACASAPFASTAATRGRRPTAEPAAGMAASKISAGPAGCLRESAAPGSPVDISAAAAPLQCVAHFTHCSIWAVRRVCVCVFVCPFARQMCAPPVCACAIGFALVRLGRSSPLRVRARGVGKAVAALQCPSSK